MSSLLSNLSLEGRTILVLIGAFLLYAVGNLFQAWSVLNREEKAIQELRNAPPEDIIATRLRLVQVGDVDAVRLLSATLDTGQSDTSLLTFYERIHWARYFAGMFVFLGLLGTVWGISSAISHLSGTAAASGIGSTSSSNSIAAFDSVFSQSTQLQHSIGGLLEGIKSASVCTFFGISATVLLSLLNSIYLNRCRRIETDVVRLASARFVPLWVQESSRKNSRADEQSYLRDLKEATTSLQTATTGLQDVTTSLKSAAEHLAGDITSAATNVTQVAAHTEKLAEKLTATASSLETALGGLSEERTGLGAASTAVGTAADKMMLEVRALREALAKSQLEQDTRQQSLADSLETTHKSLRDLLRHFEGALNDVASIAEDSPLRHDLLHVKNDLTEMIRNLETKLSAAQARRETPAVNTAAFSEEVSTVIRQSVVPLEERMRSLESSLSSISRTLSTTSRAPWSTTAVSVPPPFTPSNVPPVPATPKTWLQRARGVFSRKSDSDSSRRDK